MPIISGGGGLSNPVTIPLEITADAPDVFTVAGTDATGDNQVLIQAPAGYHQSSGDGYLLHAFAGDGTDVLNFDPSGALFLQAAAEEGTEAFIEIDGTSVGNDLALRAASGIGLDRIAANLSSRLVFRVLDAGGVSIGQNAAPVDADVLTGHAVLWLDDTNGASKLMVKAKSANGTIVTGSVTLA